MNEFDHFVKEDLRCKYYLRYVDDFVCFHNDKAFLHKVTLQMSKYFEGLRLKLHPKKSIIFPVRLGVPYLGYKVFPYHRRLCKNNSMEFRRKLRRYRRQYHVGEKGFADISRSVQCWIAHASHADTYRLRDSIFSEVDFYKKYQN